MDRVRLSAEEAGSATYYMGFAPEEYGERLYDMECYGDVVIRKVLVDIGKQRTKPHQIVSSSEEYDDLIWKSKGRTIYSCSFEIAFQDIDAIVLLDFEMKRLTLKVDPAISQKQKHQIADFFEILTTPDYYELKEMQDFKIAKLLWGLAFAALAFTIIAMPLDFLGFFSALPSRMTERFTNLIQIIILLFLAVYYAWVAIKRRQLKKKRRDLK